jgi:high mobility group protein B1
MKGKHPSLSIGDVAKKLGEMWNSPEADDKHPCSKKAIKVKATELKENQMHRKGAWSRLNRERKRRKRNEEKDEKDEEEMEEEADKDKKGDNV